MTVARASLSILRHSASPLRRLPVTQARFQTGRSEGRGTLGKNETPPGKPASASSRDHLGGPGGQQAPPPKPGGPQAITRNWIYISQGAIILAAGYWYFTNPSARRSDPKA